MDDASLEGSTQSDPAVEQTELEFRRRCVAYFSTVATMWLVWALTGAPTGPPGAVGSDEAFTVTLGLWPAWLTAFGFIDLAQRAFLLYAHFGETTGEDAEDSEDT